MDERKFSKWVLFKKQPAIDLPGIYVLAVSEKDLTGEEFSWIEEIKYIGMTNSKKGLKGRLKQFENTMRGKTGHGGARRFRKTNEYKDPDRDIIDKNLFSKLYVSVAPFGSTVIKDDNPPEVLKTMGEVAKAEYECFALYRKKFGPLPQYNDKKKSEKHYD